MQNDANVILRAFGVELDDIVALLHCHAECRHRILGSIGRHTAVCLQFAICVSVHDFDPFCTAKSDMIRKNTVQSR
jgi:hypothetical protein